MKAVVTRFAPSPTGFLHIGSARTALYDFLFARNTGGKLLLRIEDTDRERSRQLYTDSIVEDLKWLGIEWDGEVMFQSKRLEAYRKCAGELLDKGMAYEDPGEEGTCIRFRVPGEKIVVKDLIHGEISFDNSLLGDIVIMKSDGYPAYNFACVVDDVSMGITHVIRGDDHISNTPKQIPIYGALGAAVPLFAHVPMILAKEGGRLSKRHGATSVSEYRKDGFLPEGIVNYLALLGWSPGGNKEVMGMEEMVKSFSIKRVNQTSATFDIEKLSWLNGQHMNRVDIKRLVPMAKKAFVEAGLMSESCPDGSLAKVVELFRSRAKTLRELVDASAFLFRDEICCDEEAAGKFLRREGVPELLSKLADEISGIGVFEAAEIERACRKFAEDAGQKAAEIIHPARVALTGKSVSPGLFEVMAVMGKEKVVRRLKNLPSFM